MAAVGGSLESVSFEGREFPVAADAESQRKLGGVENEFEANGNGTGRLIKTRVGLFLGTLTVEIDDSRQDQEYIQELANRNDFFVVTATYASGITYQGSAQFTGEIQYTSNNSTAVLSLMGPGELTPQ